MRGVGEPSSSLFRLGVCSLMTAIKRQPHKVAELFAGVGGFRLGLERAGWQTTYSNQWEPSTIRQHASEVYTHNFGGSGHSNEDIATVEHIPSDFDLLVGGFPCQDYSVAKSKSSATGLQGKKGVLWWEILRLTERHKPKFLFLENVDRLLKSPATQRGRDFAVMLASLGNLGYAVEWRVINAADYGFPQKRRRVFIVAELGSPMTSAEDVLAKGVLASTFKSGNATNLRIGALSENLVKITEDFGVGEKVTPWRSSGAMVNGTFQTQDETPLYSGSVKNLGDVLLPATEVPKEFFISEDSLDKWKYLKGAKSENRTHKSGFEWKYTEGAMSFPDPLDRPSRTILTGEGGQTPSRFKHVIDQEGRLRRLHPIELERLNGFPDDWTKTGTHGDLSDSKRAFFMGNALVVGLINMVGKTLASRLN